MPTRDAQSPVRQRGWALALVVVLIAALGVGLTPRRACACNTVEKARRTMLRADLRDIAAAQQEALARTGRFLTQSALLASSSTRLSRDAVVRSWTERDDGLEVRLASVRDVHAECWIVVPRGTPGAVTLGCAPFPLNTGRLLRALAYAGLVAIIVALALRRAREERRPVGLPRRAALIGLASVHPFWPPVRTTEACDWRMLLEWPALCLALAVAIGAVVGARRRQPQPPASA